ncbi:MAG: peptidoglycan DD-metalloendopeptidase family protein [Bacteroidales bacterium]|jgi:septal ring factor EnvC (AmiA/AmiB activator)|nr:peptidoglycan DD-metalloendopeptidase family protein [Bacteroidales bacterium]
MKKLHIILVLLLLALVSPTFGQKTKGKSKKQLQSEINSLQKEISTANQLLKKTKKDKEMTLNEVNLLDKKIKQRENLIKAYNQQIAVLDEEINTGQSNIKTLNSDLKKLRKEYAKMIVFANKNRSHYDMLGFVFASKDFNQAFRRLRYIREFNEARKVKIDQIVSTERRINDEVEASQKAREEQAAMLKDEKAQQEALQKEKKDLNGQVAKLKKKEGSIQQDIKNKQQQAKKLQKAIDDIIAEEIRKANAEAERKRKEEAKKNANKGKATTAPAPKEKGMALTPAEKTLSSNFVNNKGNLPWPVERGVISSSFGKHASVVSDKVTVTNNGIDIATTEGAQARAVFEGEVASVVKLTGANTVVIIRHGEYFTVYSNLENVTVKRGDKVKTKQNIGTVHTNKTEDKTELHFELLKEQNRQNPANWLSK